MRAQPPALLDVNVLIALFDETHVHHEVAHAWFADDGAAGWTTRESLVERLRTFCGQREHTFWSDSVSLHDETLFDPTVIVSHRQVTDLYMLGLAVRMKGRLATFDGSIPRKAVKGAGGGSLVVLGQV